jgi:hypothetical protein
LELSGIVTLGGWLVTSNSGAGLQPGHVAMHTDANIQANRFIVRGIIPELTGLGVHA